MAERQVHDDDGPDREGPPWRWWTGPGRGDGPDEGPTGTGAGARWPWRSTLLVTAVAVIGTTFAAQAQPDREPLGVAGRLLLVGCGLLLVARWRHPVAVVFGTALGALAYLAAGFPYGPVFLTLAVACFSAVVAGHRRAAWTAVGLWWAGHLLVSHAGTRWLPPTGDAAAPWSSEVIIGAWLVAILAVSELGRVRREQWHRERAERRAAAHRRADEERLRIARELHDVLAHSISVINVQAGVGLALLDSDPEQARTALTTIKGASKEALGEVRQVLDALRTPGTAPLAPAPGIDRLPELAEQAARAGLAVEVTTEGTPRPLPPGTDLAAFRIVQEALTNVVRHSGSRRARVLVRYGDDRHLLLLVDDDGPATAAEAGGSGNGLAGMRERAAALGGTIEAGARPDGGFRVGADLPLVTRRAPVEPPREGP
ncbi:histidine kinase [Streptomyces sp. NPDC005955]|uniref:sensor histidine kinase n=1 Tax=Streptomyces sp. NPDC005955 TaxID=3364738 RepID=UPI0036C14238